MFSPGAAVTAGALVVAVAGVMVVAQPFRQSSVTAPGAGTTANALVLEDGTDDFYAQPHYAGEGTWVETRGPADADLVGVIVSIDGDRLTVRFDAAKAVPQAPDAPDPTVYQLLIDTDGDPEPEYATWSEYTEGDSEDPGDDGWVGSLWHLEGDRIDDETSEVVEGAVTMSIDLDALPVAPSQMRFAAMTKIFGGFDDTNNIFNWQPIDRVPDDQLAWRTLDEGADS